MSKPKQGERSTENKLKQPESHKGEIVKKRKRIRLGQAAVVVVKDGGGQAEMNKNIFERASDVGAVRRRAGGVCVVVVVAVAVAESVSEREERRVWRDIEKGGELWYVYRRGRLRLVVCVYNHMTVRRREGGREKRREKGGAMDGEKYEKDETEMRENQKKRRLVKKGNAALLLLFSLLLLLNIQICFVKKGGGKVYVGCLS